MKIIKRLPTTRRVQIIHVESKESIELVEQYEPYVHAFLLDSGKPEAITAELGGTGRTHDWGISKEIIRRTSKPVFLAGGLSPDYVRIAIEDVKPFGIDICSGVRTDDWLSINKLNQLMKEIS